MAGLDITSGDVDWSLVCISFAYGVGHCFHFTPSQVASPIVFRMIE
jgi:hypothetical protein